MVFLKTGGRDRNKLVFRGAHFPECYSFVSIKSDMDMMRVWLFLLLFVWGNGAVAQISPKDKAILRTFWKYAEKHNLAELPVNERISYVARFFIGTPYKGNTLNVTKGELPVINLRELDCVTFIENVLALSFLPGYGAAYESAFVRNIVKIRYRNGEIEDYASRLHYSSDWLYEMQRQRLLTDLTLFAGGVDYRPQVCFMTRHYDRYPALKDSPELREKMKGIEAEINKRTYYYVPKAEVDKAYGKIKDGDIILFTTNIEGLDTSHIGFALKQNGNTYLLHASSSGKQVMISKNPLKEYMEGVNIQSGIMLARAAKVVPANAK